MIKYTALFVKKYLVFSDLGTDRYLGNRQIFRDRQLFWKQAVMLKQRKDWLLIWVNIFLQLILGRPVEGIYSEACKTEK